VVKRKYMQKSEYAGIRVLIMGLGLHGGGLESARYFAERGADVTVTDLGDEERLAPSLRKLEGLRIRYVLGRHEMADFEEADIVVKNPGVRPDSPYLLVCRRVETDLSLFLARNPARLTAITGSKGKSTTASAVHWVLQAARSAGILPGGAYLGGNITLSPLTFLDNLTPQDDVVLELSSWQIGDLRGRRKETGEALLKPRAAILTGILPDHLDRYGGMDAYVEDKRIIYRGQDARDVTVVSDDSWGRSFRAESKARPLSYGESPLPPGLSGGWLTGAEGPGLARLGGEVFEAVPRILKIPGYHQKKNILAGALALLDLNIPREFVRESLGRFPGLPHRLEFFHTFRGIRFYNDTASTIPEAAAAAVSAFDRPPILVAGGTDKQLDFSPLVSGAAKAKALILLAGTGTDRLMPLLRARGIAFQGAFDALEPAVAAALRGAASGDPVVLSPGCASFGMFLNEFDRGAKWKAAVLRLTGSIF
jgi:UDP-N-acetylmuramoylalanine--D-glutamate ligase